MDSQRRSDGYQYPINPKCQADKCCKCDKCDIIRIDSMTKGEIHDEINELKTQGRLSLLLKRRLKELEDAFKSILDVQKDDEEPEEEDYHDELTDAAQWCEDCNQNYDVLCGC